MFKGERKTSRCEIHGSLKAAGLRRSEKLSESVQLLESDGAEGRDKEENREVMYCDEKENYENLALDPMSAG